MQSFNTELSKPETSGTITVGRAEILSAGHSITVDLPNCGELALHNVDSEYHATENFCPHKGAPLAEGVLCGHIVECAWHGWQFDVRTGECLTVPDKIKTYEVVIEDGLIKIELDHLPE